MGVIRRHRWLQGLLLMGPAAAWTIAFVVIPTGFAIYVSLSQVINYKLVGDLTFESYSRFFSESIYVEALVRSVKTGLIVAVLAVAMSLPLAHFICFRVRKRQLVWFALVVAALFMGYLLRVFGWRILLGKEGIINQLAMSVGITDHPISWLVFSPFAIILAQTHLAMPFAFIPIYVVMSRVPKSLFDAADDLGAPRWKQWVHVELPLIVPGLVAGGTFAFVIAFGDFFAPSLVGDAGSLSIGNLAANQFSEGVGWPLGAAIGVVMTVTVLLVVAIPATINAVFRRRRSRDIEKAGSPMPVQAGYR